MKYLKLLGWLVIPLLLWWAMRSISLDQIWSSLSRLTLIQIASLITLNLIIFFLFTSRWWLISRQQGIHPPYHRLVLYRLAAFGISYYTPGPQLGGLPLQVHLLHKHHAVPYSAALAGVSLDKLIDLSVNFTVLLVGVVLMASNSLFSQSGYSPLILLASLLLLIPLIWLTLLYLGVSPLRTLKARMSSLPRLSTNLEKIGTAILNSEEQVTDLIRRRPRLVLGLFLLSLLIWSLLILEYYLTLRYLGLSLPLLHAIALLTAARLAFLTPMPGGIGALEAAQVFAFSTLGYGPALGITASLLIRARDLSLGAVGLWLTPILTKTASSRSYTRQISD